MFRTTKIFCAVGLLTSSAVGLAMGCSTGDLGGGSGGNNGGAGGQSTGSKGTSSGDPMLTGTGGSTSSGMANCQPGAVNLDGCACQPGTPPRDCYDGDPKMAGVGACVKGKQECKTVNMNEFMGGTWQPCIGSGKPSPEICDGKADEDCDGKIDNGCACVNGTTQGCALPNGGMGTQTCTNGVWGPCGCTEGTSQQCVTAQGGMGVQVCTMNQWGPCTGGTCGGPITAGQPCNTPGVAIPTPPNTCGCGDQGVKVEVIYCDNQGTWQCFLADDCNPATCTPCLQQNCGQYMKSNVPACQKQLDTAVTWLDQCGPDRNAWFNNLNQGCPNNEVSQLNQCKFQHCIMNGTCSFY